MAQPPTYEELLRRVEALEEQAAQSQEEIDALRRTRRHLQAILDNANLPIFLKSEELTYILVNRQYEQLANVASADLVGKTDFDVFTQPVAELFRSQDEEVKQRRTQVDFEETITLADGEFTFLTSKFPVFDTNGEVWAIGGVCTDITTLERTQAALRVSEEKFKSIVQNTPLGMHIYRLEPDGRLVFIGANPAADAILGWDNQRFLGKTIEEAFPPLAETDIPARYRRACSEGESWHGRHVAYEHGAISGAFEVTAFQTSPGTMAAFFSNITSTLKLEQEVSRMQKLESIGVLAGGIAHDFNNLLGAITGNISLAAHYLDADDEKRTPALLSAAQHAAQKAHQLTQQLLTFSRGGAPVREVAAIADVIKESVDFALHGSNTRCDCELAADLWPVEIDAGQMSQVVQNLIINASQAMPEGGTVRVRCENVANDGSHTPPFATGEFVKLSFEDDGVGIPAEIIDKIFDPYFSTKPSGSGLGLAITHSVIAKHGGHITAVSEPGVGTRIEIHLPAVKHAEVAAKPVLPTPVVRKNGRMLVMDDDVLLRSVVREMGLAMGLEVLVAGDGAEAIHLYAESLDHDQPIDLVIMDLTVPGGMGGEAAIKEILALDPNAKVVVSSGYSNDPVMANFRDYGFKAAIAKPFDLDAITRVVCELLADPAS